MNSSNKIFITLIAALFFGLLVAAFLTAERTNIIYVSYETGLIRSDDVIFLNWLSRKRPLVTIEQTYRETGYSWFLIGYPTQEDIATSFEPVQLVSDIFPLDPSAHHVVFAFLISQNGREELKTKLVDHMSSPKSEGAKRFKRELLRSFEKWLNDVNVLQKPEDMFRRWEIDANRLPPNESEAIVHERDQ